MSDIGKIFARLTRLSVPGMYRLDFTEHTNEYDSDDEGDDWQWSHSIEFEYDYRTFANLDEIPYGTSERYTGCVFWRDQSTTIAKMVTDTMRVRKARGENIDWPVHKLSNAADTVWYKMR